MKTNKEVFLDVGCGFAQDLRFLITSGVNSSNVYGTDIDPRFIDLSYELFRDEETLRSQFLAANFLEGDGGVLLTRLGAGVDIIQAANFLHLFNWETQKACARMMLKLLKDRKGSLIVGRQVGNIYAREYENPLAKDPKDTMYRHNPESFERLWKELAGDGVKVSAELKPFDGDDTGLVVEDWTDPSKLGDANNSRLYWSVERI
jgi:SAM-dependent methyltransferase